MSFIKTIFFDFYQILKRVYFLIREKKRRVLIRELIIEDQVEKFVCYGNQLKIKLKVENLVFIKIENIVIPIFSDKIPISIKYPTRNGKHFINIRLIGISEIKRIKIKTINDVPVFITPKLKRNTILSSILVKNNEPIILENNKVKIVNTGFSQFLIDEPIL